MAARAARSLAPPLGGPRALAHGIAVREIMHYSLGIGREQCSNQKK